MLQIEDTTLKGAKETGDKVKADIGGNLNLESQQDKETYDEKNSSAQISLSLDSVQGSVNKGKINSNYQSVTQQTGIYAGKQGFDIKVGKNTDLKGAVIASEADASKNKLSTDTPGKTTTVLETFKSDTGAIIDELGNVKSMDFGSREGGFNLLNTPDEIYKKLGADGFLEQCNKPWLDNAIKRNDIIKIATEPTYDNLYRTIKATGETELTGFGREFEYLKSHGYTYDPVTKSMIK